MNAQDRISQLKSVINQNEQYIAQLQTKIDSDTATLTNVTIPQYNTLAIARDLSSYVVNNTGEDLKEAIAAAFQVSIFDDVLQMIKDIVVGAATSIPAIGSTLGGEP